MVMNRSLLIAVLATAVTAVRSAEVPCRLHWDSWGEIKISGQTLGVSDTGSVVVGGAPRLFAYGSCKLPIEAETKDSSVEGYIVDAYDTSKCISLAKDDEQVAFALKPCKFQDNGRISALQTFAIIPDQGDKQTATAYYKSHQTAPISKSQPPFFTLHAELNRPGIDGDLGRLLVSHEAPGAKVAGPLTLSLKRQADKLPAQQPVLKCTEISEGQLIFNNQSSSGIKYDGPINANWEADAMTSDKFLFQKCDYSLVDFKDSEKYAFGRLRPVSDKANGGFSCYSVVGRYGGYGPTAVPARRPEITSIETRPCSHNVVAGRDLVRYNKKTGTVKFIPYPHLRRPGTLYWYTRADYVKRFRVEQDLKHPSAIGQAYLDPENPLVTKFPPGKLTFKADAGAADHA